QVGDGDTFGRTPLGLTDNDGRAPGTSGRNLVYNGDFSIHTPPTGQQSTRASSVRVDDVDQAGTPRNATPNGWTRNFENGGNGEGVIYRTDLSGLGFTPNGTWSLLMQDRQSSVGDNFACVCDAFPVVPGKGYKFSSNVYPGIGS